MPFDEILESVPALPKRRACLCCAKAFDSAWAGERICPRCKASSTWREDLVRNGSNHARYQSKNRRTGIS